MNNFREVIQKVSRGEKLSKDLTREEARQALQWIFEGKASEFQIGAFFAAMRMKGESSEETVGLVEACRERAIQIRSRLEGVLDIGDPYDGKVKTLHLSVPTALILAAAGIPVILHSAPETPVKRGVETQKVLEALGVEIYPLLDPPPLRGGGNRWGEILEKEKIVFLPTENLVPDFARLRPYREAFGLRPFANHIEKIFNLANATTQMVGIYHRPYLERVGEALVQLGTPRNFVIQGVEGFTELFCSRKTLVLHIEGGKSESLTWDPLAFGINGEEELIPGKAAESHAKRIEELLQGGEGPARASLVWNGGVKLFWMKRAASVEEGIHLAKEILDSGKALAKLESFRKASREKITPQKV